MKTEKKIFIAFLLNTIFSIFELIGGIITGSVAITTDAIHDFGDAISISSAFILEKISRKKPDGKYSYGYKRFSVLGAIITTAILLIGSTVVIYHAILRLINPAPIDYDGVLIFAIVGLIVNSLAVFFTHGGHSHNQKAVNLHMLEDVLGWTVVLVGAIVMRFTGFYLLDPILSIAVALFIIAKTLVGAKDILDLFLLKVPQSVSIEKIEHIAEHIDGVVGIHHIHAWAIDEQTVCATLHAVIDGNVSNIKHNIKSALREIGVSCSTIEIENYNDECDELSCKISNSHHHSHGCCHHHHH